MDLITFLSGKILKDKNLFEVLHDSSFALVIRIAGTILNYILILIISRRFGADALGVFALCITVLNISTVLGKIGIDTAMMKFVAEFSYRKKMNSILEISNTALKLIIPFSILLSAVIFIFSREIAVFIFNKEYLTEYFRITVLGVVPNIFLLLNAERLRGLKKIKEHSFLVNVSVPFFSALILVILILFSNDKRLPVSSYQSAVIISAIIGVFLWKKSFHQKMCSQTNTEKKLFRINNYRKLLELSIPMLLINSLIFLMGWTDTIMIGIFRTTFEVGIYRVPLRLAAITAITQIAIKSILGPKVAELWGKGEFPELKRIIRQSTMISFMTSIPIFLILVIFNFPILKIFGSEFTSGSTAFLMLITGQFFSSIVGSVGMILLLTGKQFIIQNVMILSTLLNIGLNYLFIPKYGINGAAFASMVSMTFINLIPFFLVKKYYGFYTFSLRNLVFWKK